MALLVTLRLPSDPLLAPAPICCVPALTVVSPVYLLVALRLLVPLPAWVNLPLPPMSLAYL
ncbi:hypothetical protein QN364_20055, partial [Undibacterium sp. CCC1.1]|nr:hypothetical protein [Undibacterium sp. CCC1.1]